jgi:hypothetical protein
VTTPSAPVTWPGKRRPVYDDVDEVAVLRCMQGTYHHARLTWDELEQVIRGLEPSLSDLAICDRIGMSSTSLAKIRERRGWRRPADPARVTRADARCGRPLRAVS